MPQSKGKVPLLAGSLFWGVAGFWLGLTIKDSSRADNQVVVQNPGNVIPYPTGVIGLPFSRVGDKTTDGIPVTLSFDLEIQIGSDAKTQEKLEKAVKTTARLPGEVSYGKDSYNPTFRAIGLAQRKVGDIVETYVRTHPAAVFKTVMQDETCVWDELLEGYTYAPPGGKSVQMPGIRQTLEEMGISVLELKRTGVHMAELARKNPISGPGTVR